MKHGKKPTLAQKKILQRHGLVPDNWLVVKDTVKCLEIVSRMALKKAGEKKVKTKVIMKEAL